MQRKWFGKVGEDWSPRCDVYLYPNAEAYNKQAPEARPNTPANTTVARKGSTILSRRIDLHVDNPNLLSNVLPHETTHAVLAGRFGPFNLPRWADEGMAVLSEPPENPARWMRLAPEFRQAGQTFSAQQLLQDRKSTRLNSSHTVISYAVFCLKKKTKKKKRTETIHQRRDHSHSSHDRHNHCTDHRTPTQCRHADQLRRRISG